MRFLIKSSIQAILLVSLLFSSWVVCVSAQSSVFAPIWMKKGAYVEYSFGDGFRFLSNKTAVEYEEGTYRWECIDVAGTLATLNVTLILSEETGVTQFSANVLVDTLNRSVFQMNGNPLGTTHLWLESSPADGEEVVLWDLSPDRVVGKIQILNGVTETPQGKQESYYVNGNGTINNNAAFFNMYCDVNTGLMTSGSLWFDGTVSALNTSVINNQVMVATNIDLGPRNDLFDFGALLPIIAIVVAFSFIFVTIYLSRRKKHKPQHK